MSNIFGEVVYPSSRAFWIEEDDDNLRSANDSAVFTVEWLENCPEKIQTLIVAETPLIIDFMKEYVVKNTKKVCTIKCSTLKEPSTIYHLSDDLYLCLVDAKVDLTLAGDFIEAVADILSKAENTVSITCNHVSQLKSAEKNVEISFMRSLSTKRAPVKQQKFCPPLNEPNMVAGVAAGVTAYAEVKRLSATLYILYIDGFELDSCTAAPLVDLLTKVIPHKFGEFHVTTRVAFDKGNLYM